MRIVTFGQPYLDYHALVDVVVVAHELPRIGELLRRAATYLFAFDGLREHAHGTERRNGKHDQNRACGDGGAQRDAHFVTGDYGYDYDGNEKQRRCLGEHVEEKPEREIRRHADCHDRKRHREFRCKFLFVHILPPLQ